MRRLLLLLLALAAVLLTATPGLATAADDLVAELTDDPLYVSPASALSPDQDAVRKALRDVRVPTYAVVVSQAAADAEELGIDGLMLRIVEGLQDPEAVVVVVTDGEQLQAGDGGSAGVNASAVLDQVLASRLDEPFTPETLTGALVDFAAFVDEGGAQEDGAAAGSAPVEPSTDRRTLGLVGLVAVAALGGGGWLYARTQRRVLAAAPLTREDLTAQEPGWQGVADR